MTTNRTVLLSLGLTIGERGRGECLGSSAWMIHPLNVSFELRRIKVHVPEISRAVSQRLVVEMRRRRIAALATRGDSPRAHAVAEFDAGTEAVAAGAVPFLPSGKCA